MIVKTKGICGGSVRIKGTRIPVWGIIKCINDGLSFEGILIDYPSLIESNINEACRYYVLNYIEIDKEIEENDKL